MNINIKHLRKKIAAMSYDGVPQVLSDALNIIQDLLIANTGLRLKKFDKEITPEEFFSIIKEQYEKQLRELLEQENTCPVTQKTLDQKILVHSYI